METDTEATEMRERNTESITTSLESTMKKTRKKTKNTRDMDSRWLVSS